MTEPFFKAQIKRLQNQYSEAAYGTERVQILWAAFKRVPDKLFELAVSEAIGNSKFAPMKNDLMAFYMEIKVKNPQLKTKYECVYCDGSGYILSEHTLPYAYRCRCPAGSDHEKHAVLWTGPLVRIVPTHAELNWNPKAREIIANTMKGLKA